MPLDYDAESLKKQQLEGDNLDFFMESELIGLKISEMDRKILKEAFAVIDDWLK